MVEHNDPNTISALIDHNSAEGLTTVHFSWDYAQPTNTYTIDQGNLSIELDRHFVARPSGLLWRAGAYVGTESVVENCFGKPFLEHVYAVRASDSNEVGSFFLFALERQNRLAIARVQAHSPSTPIILGKAIANFLSEPENQPAA